MGGPGPRLSGGAARLAARACRSSLTVLLLLLAVGRSSATAQCVRGAPDAPLTLVFSGGGAKGAWEAGVAQALVGAGVPIAVAAGSSAGALNATMIADGRMGHLEATWRGLGRDQVYAARPGVVFAGLLPGWLAALAIGRADSLLDPSPLRTMLERSVDLPRVRDSRVRIVVVATDLVRREPRVFDNATLTIDALMGATAVPGLFPAVDVGGAELVDGGIVARAPVLEALARVPTPRALVLVSYATAERGRRPGTVRRSIEEAFETAMVHQIRRDTELARLRHPTVDVQTLTPSAPLELRPLDFEPDALARALARGREDGTTCARALRAGPGAP
jgi:NTE family protein